MQGNDDGETGKRHFPVVGVGASAGGLEAFSQLLKDLPLDTGMAFVLVQHLDPEHDSALTSILARSTSLPVLAITNQQVVEPDHVYVIPPNTDLEIQRGVLSLRPRKTGRAPHRPIDTFFESLAADQGERAVGVVLSGTATDGTLGLETIKAEGGITFAQDHSAKYDSMPRSAAAAGCVDFVLSPAGIAEELARIARHPYVVARGSSAPPGETDHIDALAHEHDDSALPSGGTGTPWTGALLARSEAERGRAEPGDTRALDDGYKKVMTLLRNHCGVDFSLYRSTTIRRRINRRMVLTKQNSLEDYARWLRGNAPELDSLFSDVLISVTSFFRNPEAFEMLQSDVLPKLLSQRSNDPVRCWVLGCSTGQEAYSIAISFVEATEKTPTLRGLQVFATDLNEMLLDKARQGLYAKSLALDISPERLRRYFVEEEGGYRVSKTIREMVVFARQNLISDPPFSRVDLISCRNLLIYLEPALQKRAMPTFHYALKPGGFLMLGASESVGEFSGLFEPLDRRHKIFVKKPAPTPALHPSKGEVGERTAPRPPVARPPAGAGDGLLGELNTQREADRIAVSRFAPPGVLINDELQILQFRGPTGAFLEPPSGKASFNVLKMAREGLMLPLRAAIDRARKENKVTRTENISLRRNGEARTIHVEVIPLKNLQERSFLIAFEDAETGRPSARPLEAAPPLPAEGAAKRIAELELEIDGLREYLQTVQEQHEATHEELQSANEEVQSANEELQSINEELETSKEELESANEELTTVNEEMAYRNAELVRLNNDLVNLQASAMLAIVLLSRELTVRRFSTQAEKEFGLSATDVGSPIGQVRHALILGAEPGADVLAPIDLERVGKEVMATLREQEWEVHDKSGRWHSLRVRPYMTVDGKVDGVVLVLVDMDTLKRNEQEIMRKEVALRQSHVELQAHADELTRFNSVAVGRELRMIELKKEINELCGRLGEPRRYPLEFERQEPAGDA